MTSPQKFPQDLVLLLMHGITAGQLWRMRNHETHFQRRAATKAQRNARRAGRSK